MLEITTTQKARKFLLIGMLGAFLTLIGDLLIGYIKFPEGAGMLEGYFAAALELPIWRPILGGMIGFLGISRIDDPISAAEKENAQGSGIL